MDMFDFRARNYMNPGGPGDYGSNFNVATGAGPWATPNPRPKPFTGMDFQGPQRQQPTPFTGMEIQGPLRAPNSFAPEPPPVEEPPPYRGMEIQGPLGDRETDPKGGGYQWGPFADRPSTQQPEESGETLDQLDAKPKEYDIFERMYNAPTPALEAYKRHIMSMPKADDYKAGKMDRFIAGLTGAAEGMTHGGGAGYKAARGVVDQRYNQALQNYANEGQGLGTLAELESNDMKSKMAYAKTAMEQKRLDTKEFREGLRDAALNKLTEAQVSELNVKLKSTGRQIVDNVATGEKEIINLADGSRMSVGKFLQTAAEKADTEVSTHRRKTDIDVAGDVSKARQTSPITEQREKNILGFRIPLQAQTDLDLFNAKEPVTLANKFRLREHEAANPIPTSGFDSMAPSQTDIAFDYGNKRAAQEKPEYYKFFDPDPEKRARLARDNKPLYDAFVADSKKYNDEAIAAGKRTAVGGGGNKTVTPAPTPAVLPVRQSPISAPSAPNDPLRRQAVELLKVNKPEMANNEQAIADVIAHLRGQ